MEVASLAAPADFLAVAGGARARGQALILILADLIFPISSIARARARRSRWSSGGSSFRDIFSGMFGGGRGAPEEEGPEPGTDLEYQVNVPFWTAIRGGVMRLNISRRDTCPTCTGQGSLERRENARSVTGQGRSRRLAGG